MELKKTKQELSTIKGTIVRAKETLNLVKMEIKQITARKNFIIHQRDSLLLDFKKQNTKDWTELQKIKDSIIAVQEKLNKDRLILNALFGIQ